ncbi:MAG: preprotein translocase subunit YajC [Clostridiales bacterium]|nr:preprotein translocase subunit YajC [Clostridiales bacterium]
MTTIVFIVLLVLLIVALLVVPMFTNKKRARQTEELHRSLQPGDLIKTVGGIIGTIKEIRQVSPVDREMVIETGDGDNKTTMVFDIQALYQVMSRNSTVVSAADNANENEAESTESVAPVVEEKAPENVENEAVVEEKTEEKVVAAPEEEKTEEATAEQAAVNGPVKVEKAPAKKKSTSGAKKSTKK